MKKFIFILFLMISSMAIASDDLLGLTRWVINEGEFKIVVRYEIRDEMPVRVLEFRNGSDVLVKKIEFMDSFLSAFTLTDSNACLITIWTSGSAHKIRVFNMLNGDINTVLDVGYKGAPKFVSAEPCPTIEIDANKYVWRDASYVIGN